MNIVSAREFRMNQGRFLTAARRGQSLVLVSRYGNFKITPISEGDKLVEGDISASVTEALAHSRGEISLPEAKDVIF